MDEISRDIADRAPGIARGKRGAVVLCDPPFLSDLDRSVFDATRGRSDPPSGVGLIPLTKGFFAAVDIADLPVISANKWYARLTFKTIYAFRWVKKPLGSFMHRQILNPGNGILADHINLNGLDNRRSNLRSATRSQNGQNRRAWGKYYKGVSYFGGRYRADIYMDGRKIGLGKYRTEIEAGLAYDRAATRLFGEFARLNFPNGIQTLNAACSGEVVSSENMLALHASNITGGETGCRHASWVVALPK